MKVAREPAELERRERAVAIGTFDGVHLGHRRVIESVHATGLTPTVVTFEPHPRLALGYGVELITTLDRRLELIAELGVEDTLVVHFDLEVARTPPEEFVHMTLEPLGTRVVFAGEDFHFGHRRAGNLGLLDRLGIEVHQVPELPGVHSTAIRDHVRAGDLGAAARLLGRPFELDGVVVAGDARGGTLGYPTANLALDPSLLVPSYGIYAGAARGARAAVSIGTNPHYGGHERRIEAFLLDFEGDLYGERVILELWERLRGEDVFGSEAELVAQIGRDVARTRASVRPG